jgi:hypothetical protein
MELKNRFHLTCCEEYGMWLTLMRACYNPRSTDYKHFGAKGFYLCKELQTFGGFRHSVYFGEDLGAKQYLLSMFLRSSPNPNGKPKRLTKKSFCTFQKSFEEIKEIKKRKLIDKIRNIELQNEKKEKEKKRLANKWIVELLNGYCPNFYKMIRGLKYDFDYGWLTSFDDPEKLKFLLKYSKKGNKTIPIKTTEYHVNFINHFYYDEQFNKVYDNWINSGKDGRMSPALDHIRPKSKGGSHELYNLRFITNIENYFKGARSLEEWEYIKANPDKFFI